MAGEPDNAEQYKLVYAGEINEGQHAAVVKKRLAGVLKLDDDRMEVLFSGKAVVVKKATDARTAARYQEVFKKAGARLRVLPVEGGETAPAESAQPQAKSAPTSPPSAPPPSADAQPDVPDVQNDDNLQVLPVGADVLTDAERPDEPDAQVDTSHLSVQGAVFITDEPEPEVATPNVDHLSVAEPGAQLGEPQDEVHVDINADFDVAELGSDMGEIARETDAPIDVDAVDFDVAETGVDLDTRDKDKPPPAPDTSHLSLDDDKD